MVTRNDKGQSICQECYDRNPANKRVCSRCNKLKYISDVLELTNEIICSPCRNKDPLFHEICIYCSKLKYVCSRISENKPVCYYCYTTHSDFFRVCSSCNELKKVHTKKGPNGPLCKLCAEPLKIAECTNCHEQKVILAKKLCANCYQRIRYIKNQAKSTIPHPAEIKI